MNRENCVSYILCVSFVILMSPLIFDHAVKIKPSSSKENYGKILFRNTAGFCVIISNLFFKYTAEQNMLISWCSGFMTLTSLLHCCIFIFVDSSHTSDPLLNWLWRESSDFKHYLAEYVNPPIMTKTAQEHIGSFNGSISHFPSVFTNKGWPL